MKIKIGTINIAILFLIVIGIIVFFIYNQITVTDLECTYEDKNCPTGYKCLLIDPFPGARGICSK